MRPRPVSWSESAFALELDSETAELLNAIVPASVASYTAPPWAFADAGENARWRVVALDNIGRSIARSDWRGLRVEANPASAADR